MDYAIRMNRVSVSYLHSRKGVHSLKDFILKASFLSPFQRSRVLHDIDLQVVRGEAVGILGPNGSGKSTLLRTIAGIIRPEKGWVHVDIPVSPLLALGAGLEMELTGYENMKIALALSGNYSKKTRSEMMDRVAAFAELSVEQLRMPVKMYSTGMLARLAFSSVMTVRPELLMIDEVLAVGDKGFQKKCLNRIHEILDQGTTLLFVSHSPGEVLEICKRGVCLKDGRIVFDGPAKEAVDIYNKMFV